jgi:FHS family L-fucose permease-like MFS transporter
MNLNEVVSKNYLSLYWGGAMIGRFLGAISLNQSISQTKKAIYMLGAATLVFLVIFSIVNLTFAQISFFLVFIVLNFIAFFIGKAAPARTLSIFCSYQCRSPYLCNAKSRRTYMYSILGIGIFNSIMFSNIYTLAISGLGKYTSQGSSLVVMAILGGAIVPIFQGYLADHFGVQHSFIIPVFCYLVILIFGAYCTKYLSHVHHDANTKIRTLRLFYIL